ncbi:cell wall-binding repeat-containing protein [Streptacidiphilus sp. ASG 303]|uniref:cell wall-binding repeat-containing protein n=1 Tax=Streptacidiphilus sp. ASG 303 TaxID=2896847 RepID=UPI0027E1C52E|nr:cell wall-binding repeat-containing protein [Streptacidiphilus sp. ASG 303]
MPRARTIPWGSFLNHRLRRASAALASVLAVSAGALTLSAAPAAAAGSWPASDGRLLGSDGSNLFRTWPGGSGYGYLRPGSAPAWSPDGSRAVLVDAYQDNRLVTIRQDGKYEQFIAQKGGGGRVADPTFWYNGDSVVFQTGGRLYVGASDGSTWPQPLLAADKDGCDSQPSGSGRLLAFVRTGPDCSHTGAPAVWLYDGTSHAFRKLASDAYQPSLSADGTKVAFVRTVAGVRQLFSVSADGTGLKQLTSDGVQHTHPAWSPKGDRIAYAGGAGLAVLTPGTGGTAAVPNSAGLTDVAWQPLRYNYVQRVYGSGSTTTNVAASRWTWDTAGGIHVPGLLAAKSAVLVNSGSAPYGLTAPALAGYKQGPVLSTGGGSLAAGASAELRRVLPKGATVYLVGGTQILGSKVASQVQALGYRPVRLAGADRWSTSVAVAKASTSAPTWVFLASGTDYHEALAAAAAAGASAGNRAVVVLTNGRSLTSSVASYLNGLNPGTSHITPVGYDAKQALFSAYDRNMMPRWPGSLDYWYIGGTTHEAIAANLASFWWSWSTNVVLAPSNDWQAGMSAGAAMNRFGPLLWSGTSALPGPTWNYLVNRAAGINQPVVISPFNEVPSGVIASIGTAVSADGSWYKSAYYPAGAVPMSAAVSRSAAVGTAPAGAGDRGLTAPDLSGAQRLTRR